MNGLHRTPESKRRSQLAQGQVVLLGQEPTDLTAVTGNNHGLTPGQVMARADISGVAALLQEFLDHAEGDAKARGNLRSRAFFLIVGIEDPLPQIQGEGAHTQTVSPIQEYGYTIY